MPAPEVSNAMNVNIDPYPFRPTPGGAQAEVGHFGPHAGQRHEPFDGIGYVARVTVPKYQRGRFDVARLVVVETDHVDQFVELDGIDVEDVFEREPGGR